MSLNAFEWEIIFNNDNSLILYNRNSNNNGITRISIMALRITTLRITTLRINDILHNDAKNKWRSE
jgi:hypothetical protein